MDNTYDIGAYSGKLEKELTDICRRCGFNVTSAEDMLLASPDIDRHWQRLGGDYIADAMPQIADYPTVAVAWAAYLGMAVACGWDSGWELCSNMPYSSYYGRHGFDDMDDHIMQDILGYATGSAEEGRIRELFRKCADAAVSLIRHENIEPQSITAYQVFVATCQEMYRLGAALELHLLGYKFERIG